MGFHGDWCDGASGKKLNKNFITEYQTEDRTQKKRWDVRAVEFAKKYKSEDV